MRFGSAPPRTLRMSDRTKRDGAANVTRHITLAVPSPLKTAFKMEAARRGMSMAALFTELFRAAQARDARPKL